MWKCFAVLLSGCFLLQQPVQAALVALDETGFGRTNFSVCDIEHHFTTLAASRYYDPVSQNYTVNITGVSDILVNSLNQNQTLSAASRLELVLGFSTIINSNFHLCPDINTGCPVQPNVNVSLYKTVKLPPTAIPLGDLIGRYAAWTVDQRRWMCVNLAPIGYQHPTWQAIFLWLPVGFTVFAALSSFLISFFTAAEGDAQDLFIFTSNYAMPPAIQRLKTPSFFDFIYYAQFIVTSGLMNLHYPAFYPLFTANFAWSFLLVPISWMTNVVTSIEGDYLKNSPFANMTVGSNSTSIYRHVVDPLLSGSGMRQFAHNIHLDYKGLFVTCIIVFAFIMIVCAILCAVLWASVQLLSMIWPHKYAGQSRKLGNFSLGIFLRALTLFYVPLATLSFYQLMLPSPWYMLFVSSIVVVFPIFLLYGYVAIVLFNIRPSSLMYSDITMLLRYGSLYNLFKEDHYPFFIPFLVCKVIVSAMLGIFQSEGVAQVVVVLLCELALLAALYLRWPFVDRHINVYSVIFAAFRVVITIFNLVYIDGLGVLERDKQYIGYLQVLLHCVALFLMFLLTVKNVVVLLSALGTEEYTYHQAPLWKSQWGPAHTQDPSIALPTVVMQERGSLGMDSRGSLLPIDVIAEPPLPVPGHHRGISQSSSVQRPPSPPSHRSASGDWTLALHPQTSRSRLEYAYDDDPAVAQPLMRNDDTRSSWQRYAQDHRPMYKPALTYNLQPLDPTPHSPPNDPS
ncbi:uncharacterized protein BYT42DRAFT_546763 [Radiomyces spectabilis]|uniref:uncharacterized protein n=1 Tax=Radiomyces spectabilis TaxID=64574 RepID=UPI00221EFFDA|nr:uncharacterized protein BYT42DRAFT_546763 [Radiomyces spectabilis]KAI8376030.1 hypothetical protein BYT42DRAFT_546763 [Radiomyces spectabilis]